MEMPPPGGMEERDDTRRHPRVGRRGACVVMMTTATRLGVGQTLLRIEGLSKTFGGTRALIDADLDVRADEIHALVGSNGSGKSTLIKALAGFHRPDPGSSAWFEDEPFQIGSALDHGHDRLRFVHQDLGHVLELGVIDNLALRNAYVRGRFGRIRWAEQERAARELLDRFGVDM